MREEIIRACAKIISKEGLEAASTRSICDKVGITAPTLYYYFKKKESLLDAVTEYAFTLHRENKKRLKTEDPIQNLHFYWDEFIQFSIHEPELHRSMLVALAQGRMVSSGLACFHDLLAEFKILEKEGRLQFNALEAAQIYLSAAQGILSLSLANKNSDKVLLHLSEPMREISLQGLLKNYKKIETKQGK